MQVKGTKVVEIRIRNNELGFNEIYVLLQPQGGLKAPRELMGWKYMITTQPAFQFLAKVFNQPPTVIAAWPKLRPPGTTKLEELPFV